MRSMIPITSTFLRATEISISRRALMIMIARFTLHPINARLWRTTAITMAMDTEGAREAFHRARIRVSRFLPEPDMSGWPLEEIATITILGSILELPKSAMTESTTTATDTRRMKFASPSSKLRRWESPFTNRDEEEETLEAAALNDLLQPKKLGKWKHDSYNNSFSFSTPFPKEHPLSPCL